MGSSATLMERMRPYVLLAELARGKVNQMRCQAADWRMGGLQINSTLQQAIRDATMAFGKAATNVTGGKPTAAETQLAESALLLGYQGAQKLVEAYIEQVFQIRHQRMAKFDSTLGCRVSAGPPDRSARVSHFRSVPYKRTFNSISIAFPCATSRPTRNVYVGRLR